MNYDAEVIEFRVPTENNKTLFICGILPTFSEAYIYESLWNIFSEFGALYWLKVAPNATVALPGFYAIVKFYSAVQAFRAQKATHAKGLLQKSPLKVQLCTRRSSTRFHDVKLLSVSKCQELANYYLGFNGWTSRVITLKNISGSDAGERQVNADSQKPALKYGCVVGLNFPHHGVACRGVGIAEEVFEGSPEEVAMKRGLLPKRARDRAMMDAFAKVLLVVLDVFYVAFKLNVKAAAQPVGCEHGNGKVVVDCKLDADDITSDGDLEGMIKVNDVSWGMNEDEDEDFPDFTLNFSDLS